MFLTVAIYAHLHCVISLTGLYPYEAVVVRI